MTSIEKFEVRDALMQSIRAFFHSEGFIEVETPIRMKTPCMELHIDAEPSGDRWLRTSPELYHKKLLAQGARKIFEIGKCFRQGERGDRHHPEYTMLEWYRAGGDYNAMLKDVKSIVGRVTSPGVSKDWKIFTIAEIYERFAGWNPVENFDVDRFDFDMVEKIEPNLPKDAPVILMDYPAECCALARLKPNNPKVAERWELYLGGIEIANAYSELTDPVEQRARFEKWGEQRRALGKTVYPIDEEFIQCLESMPPSGGCALGIDRLLMALIGTNTLDDILPFRD
ncbi:MAG: EF-P lysine aminoacylase EpmA [Kiritimatiellales bacterium]